MRIFNYLLLFYLLPISVYAISLENLDDSTPVYIRNLDFDLKVAGPYVGGKMEVQFSAEQGLNHSAHLRFPLPTGSVLYKAEIFIPQTEKWMTAETLGRQHGQTIYNDIVRQNIDPLLIQRIGPDLYRARVFPINEQVGLRIRVYYAHLLEPLDNLQHLLKVPLINPDSTSAAAQTLTLNLHTENEEWSLGNWQVQDELGHSTTQSNSSQFLELENFTLDRNFHLTLTAPQPIPEALQLTYQPAAQTLSPHHFIHWTPNLNQYPELQAQNRHVIFVIDVSGSMSGAKMAQTRQAIISCLQALTDQDYFGLVAFDSEVYTFRQEMLTSSQIEAATRWVSRLEAGSGTAMAAGLIQAVNIGNSLPTQPLDLILITDGLPNEGSTTVPAILTDVKNAADTANRSIRIFTVGIGNDLDQTLLNGLAQQTAGESTFALKDNEIAPQVLQLFSRVRSGGLQQLTVELLSQSTLSDTFNWPRLFPGNSLTLATTSTAPQLHLTGQTAQLLEIQLNTTPTLYSPLLPEFSRLAAPLAAKAWADELERHIDRQGETSTLINEAVALARKYGILTRYSSLLALETEELYAEHGVERIERDLAGIALQNLSGSPEDESQIGGEGTETENAPIPPPRPLPEPFPIEEVSADAPFADISPVTPQTEAVTAGESSKEENEEATEFDSEISPADDQDETIQPSGEDKPETTCQPLTLNSQLQLFIPQLQYQDRHYWAKLTLDSLIDGRLILKVTEYGDLNFNDPNECTSILLTENGQVKIAKVIYQTAQKSHTFTDITLQLIPAPSAEEIWFEIIDFQKVN